MFRSGVCVCPLCNQARAIEAEKNKPVVVVETLPLPTSASQDESQRLYSGVGADECPQSNLEAVIKENNNGR